MNQNNHDNYNNDEDFLSNLYANSEFLFNSFCKFVMIGLFIVLFFMLLFFSPIIGEYYYKQHKGIKTDYPIVFEVNGESYPDLKNLDDFEVQTINLDTIPMDGESILEKNTPEDNTHKSIKETHN